MLKDVMGWGIITQEFRVWYILLTNDSERCWVVLFCI